MKQTSVWCLCNDKISARTPYESKLKVSAMSTDMSHEWREKRTVDIPLLSLWLCCRELTCLSFASAPVCWFRWTKFLTTYYPIYPFLFRKYGIPIICYKYNNLIRNTILNCNTLVSDLDIETSSPDSWECKDSKFCYQQAGHIITGNLKIISNSRIRSVISKGPKYRFPTHIDLK